MWEGISRPGPGRDGMGGKEREILVPGDVQVEGPKAIGNPPGRQGPEITKNRSLLKYLLIITSSILARFRQF